MYEHPNSLMTRENGKISFESQVEMGVSSHARGRHSTWSTPWTGCGTSTGRR